MVRQQRIRRRLIFEKATTATTRPKNKEEEEEITIKKIIIKNKKFNLLVGIPSPRDIPAFREGVDKTLSQYDKLWAKGFKEAELPYSRIRQYFLDHWQDGAKYTHLGILPDDVILNEKGVNKLINDVIEHPKKYKVIMGMFPTEWGSSKVALTPEVPLLDMSLRYHNFYEYEQVKGKGIIKVGWCGTPFAIISGDLIASGIVSLQNDSKWNRHLGTGCCQDVVLANELASHNIPLYVDTDVLFLHLKGLPVAEVYWDD